MSSSYPPQNPLKQREPRTMDTSIPALWLDIQIKPLRIRFLVDLALPQVTNQNKAISPLWQVIILVFVMYSKQEQILLSRNRMR